MGRKCCKGNHGFPSQAACDSIGCVRNYHEDLCNDAAWGVKVQNASSGKSIYSFKSSVRYFPEICILSSVLIAELTRLALPGQNDQFPWPEKNSVEPKRCDGKQVL